MWPYEPRKIESPKACRDQYRLLLDVSSPCSRLEFLYEREQTLIDVDLEDGVEVVGCDHLTGKANDDYEFLIVEEFS